MSDDSSATASLAVALLLGVPGVDSDTAISMTATTGTDIDPALPDRGDVNVTDLSIFAQYWLETCTYPQ